MITIYSTSTCAFCYMAKAYMDDKKIEYTDVDVSKDQAAAIKMVEISGQMGVPVIDIDGDITIGFYKPVFEAKLQEMKIIK